MNCPLLPFLFRPYIVHELPGWGRLYERLGISGVDNRNERWRSAPTRTVRGKLHGYRMTLDLRDDMMRFAYFLERHFDLNMQLAIDAVVRPGDTFVDVGANIGMTTFHAARRVGSAGKVLSFEPQPGCCEFIRRTLEANSIRHVELQECGLGEAAGELPLEVIGGGSIMATFVPVESGVMVRETIRARVRKGDEALRGIAGKNLVIKIDVEGFELHTLRGLTGTIDEHRPLVFTEVEPAYLRRAGDSEHALFEYFQSRGYRAFDVRLRRRGLRWRSELAPVRTPGEMKTMDALWVPAESPFDPTRGAPAARA